MSFVKIDNNNFEHVSLKLRPNVSIISSSIAGGITGSNFVSPLRSKTLKLKVPLSFDFNNDGKVSLGEALVGIITSPETVLKSIHAQGANYGNLDHYLKSVGAAQNVERNTKQIDIFRFDQPVLFNKNRQIKNIVRKNFMPYHEHRYDNCGFYYSNYHTLNFVNSETLSTGSALLYPNPGEEYDLPKSFSVNFWVNPRYSDPGEYNASTIFHLSSSIAISLVSGSDKDEFNGAQKFKVLLQLSQSADRPPSSINLNSPSTGYPNDLIFTSSHYLTKNHWHHICVQWSQKIRNGHGSLYVDDDITRFYIPSASLHANKNLSPGALVIGNYYDGLYDNLGKYLNQTKSVQQGFASVVSGASVTDPTTLKHTFTHPMKGEVHEIKMYNKFLPDPETILETERKRAKNRGPSNYNNLIFYVPPFFYPKTPKYEVPTTPFKTHYDFTDDPFNVAFSFGILGKMINLPNFTREFVYGRIPRHLGLYPKTINSTVQNITADEFMYTTASNKKINLTILPNDNGLFEPNYYALSSSPMSQSLKFFKSGFTGEGMPDYSIISLENLIPSSSLHPGLVQSTGSMFDIICSASAENPGNEMGTVLTIAQRTRDLSSNEVVIYDITNLYYGNRIHPGSFSIYEKDLTGSDGRIKIRLRDNEKGSLYRADAMTKHATWNSVGNILYDEGIAIVKSPHLFFFSKDETNVSFKGEQNLHTMILNVPAYKELFNSSSNPTFTSITPTTGSQDGELSTLYITTVNIHDDNLNIIMKANLSQPIFKSEDDEFIIRLKEDF